MKSKMNQQQKQNAFLAKVNQQSGVRPNGPATDCWEWTGTIHPTGYGQLLTNWSPDRYAHRTAYLLFTGDIPDGRLIRHRCDNRRCVNPEHLELGTKADNNRDARERNPKASGRKLQDADLPAIADRMKAGELLKDIAIELGMNWKCVSRRLASAGLRPEYSHRAKVNEETIARMRTLRTAGASYEEIAKDVGVSAGCVWGYLN